MASWWVSPIGLILSFPSPWLSNRIGPNCGPFLHWFALLLLIQAKTYKNCLSFLCRARRSLLFLNCTHFLLHPLAMWSSIRMKHKKPYYYFLKLFSQSPVSLLPIPRPTVLPKCLRILWGYRPIPPHNVFLHSIPAWYSLVMIAPDGCPDVKRAISW